MTLNKSVSALLGATLFAFHSAHGVNLNNPAFDTLYGGLLSNYYDRGNTMPNVVAMYFLGDSGLEQECTGTLLNSRTVLTAAHCVANSASERLNSSIQSLEVRFSPDPNSMRTRHDRKIRDVIFHENYFDQNLDIAIFSLDRPVHGIQPVQLAPAGYVVNIGDLATIVGYGLAGSGTNPGRSDGTVDDLPGHNDSRRRIAVTQIGSVGTNTIQAQFRIPGSADNPNVFDVPGAVPLMQGQPEGGDSGGPLFIQTPSGWLQIGTVIGGGDGLYGGSGYASIDEWTWLPYYADWLQTNTQALLSSTKVASTATGAKPVFWSQATTWGSRPIPKNSYGHLDVIEGDWERGTYYDVDVTSPMHVIVDENVDINSLYVDHKDAKVEIPNGNVLYTALDTELWGGEVKVDGTLDSDIFWLDGGRLTGTGLLTLETGLRQNGGVLAPGGSPGTLTIAGNVALGPGARFEAEIDGTGTANGAGNYDRLLVRGQYMAGGQIAPILRGISGSASNAYSPALGQGFEVVNASGGISGSYSSLSQPAAGLLPGTRFDTVYGNQAITLYATPDRYSNLRAAGVSDSHNRSQLGGVLDAWRPDAGIRAADPVIKTLYDHLAPQTASTLPHVMDQLGGAGYAQLIHAGFEDSKFLVQQTDQALAALRRGEPLGAISPRAMADSVDADKLVWGHALGRISTHKSDGNGHETSNTLGGLIGGMQKRLESGMVAGYSLAYANSRPDVKGDMGRGSTDNVQLMAYATTSFDSGYFFQTTAGVGAGRISANRYVDFTQTGHRATIHTANAAVSGLAGWASGKVDEPRFEFTLGMRYMAGRHKGFDDSNSQAVSALSVGRGTMHSLAASLGAGVSLPFTARAVDWRASAWAGYSRELADTHASIDARFLNTEFNQRSSAIGRDKMTAGLALSGQVSQRTTISLNVAGETAKNWRAASASLGAQIRF